MAMWMIMDLNIGFDEDNIESECLSVPEWVNVKRALCFDLMGCE